MTKPVVVAKWPGFDHVMDRRSRSSPASHRVRPRTWGKEDVWFLEIRADWIDSSRNQTIGDWLYTEKAKQQAEERMVASHDCGYASGAMNEAISVVEVTLLTWRRCDNSSKRLR
jgi:hypothetical protein